VAANKRTLCFTTTSSKTDAVDTQHTQQGLGTRQIIADDRMIIAEQLRAELVKITTCHHNSKEICTMY